MLVIGFDFIRVLHFCGQVRLLYVVIVGFVAGHRFDSRAWWNSEESGATYSQTTYSQTTYPTYIHACMHTYILHTYIHAYIHTLINYINYIHTYMHTYIHTYITIFSHTFLLCHTPSFTFHFVTHNCFNFSILHHILCLSFLPRPRYNL